MSRAGFALGAVFILFAWSVKAAEVPGVIANYPLINSGHDITGKNSEPELKNTEFRPQGLYLNGQYEWHFLENGQGGYRAVFPVSSLTYTEFSISVDLLPLDFSKPANPTKWQAIWNQVLWILRFRTSSANGNHENIITMGPGYRWLCVKHQSNALELTLNNSAFKQGIPGATMTTNQWHRLIVAFDFKARTILTSLDGQLLAPVQIPKSLKLDVIGSPNEAVEKLVTFTDYSNGSAYHGYAADMKVFDHALSAAEMDSLAAGREWEKRPLPANLKSNSPLGIVLVVVVIVAVAAWLRARRMRKQSAT